MVSPNHEKEEIEEWGADTRPPARSAVILVNFLLIEALFMRNEERGIQDEPLFMWNEERGIQDEPLFTRNEERGIQDEPLFMRNEERFIQR
jgi:hypothetical protein